MFHCQAISKSVTVVTVTYIYYQLKGFNAMKDLSLWIALLLVAGVIISFVVIYTDKRAARKRAIELELDRLEAIEEHQLEWGDYFTQVVTEKSLVPDMTPIMVQLSWGRPNAIDQQQITKTGINKERWVYGIPRRGARYIFFTNGKVTKIQMP